MAMARRPTKFGAANEKVASGSGTALEAEPQRAPRHRIHSIDHLDRALELQTSTSEDPDARIYDIDPDSIDRSQYRDRAIHVGDDPEFVNLLDDIRRHGQAVPILVSPTESGRYRCVYGHRRAEAARQLGIRVKAIIRTIENEQSLLLQVRENLNRLEITYLERALLWKQLANSNEFTAAAILNILDADRPQLSRYKALTDVVDDKMLECLGAARGIGRPAWSRFIEAFEEGPIGARDRIHAVCDHELSRRQAGKRPQAAARLLESFTAAAQNRNAEQEEQTLALPSRPRSKVRFVSTKAGPRLNLPKDAKFTQFLWEKMPDLIAEYSSAGKEHGKTDGESNDA